MSQKEWEGVTKLELKYADSDSFDFQELNDFPNLRELTVTIEKRTGDIALEKIPHVTNLTVGCYGKKKKGRSVVIRNIEQLEYLDLGLYSSPQITIEKCDALADIHCTTNASAVRVSNLESLGEIYMSSKKLKSFQYENVSNLKELMVSYAYRIREIDLSGLDKLERFDWCEGNLEKIIWGKKDDLLTVDIHDNNFQGVLDLDKDIPERVSDISCEGNKITELIGKKKKYIYSRQNNKLRKIDLPNTRLLYLGCTGNENVTVSLLRRADTGVEYSFDKSAKVHYKYGEVCKEKGEYRIMKIVTYVCTAFLIILGNAAVANAASVNINSKNFPDTFFRYYVKMSFDKNEDGKLSGKEIEKITEIDVGDDSDYQLGYEYPAPTTLKGIEHFSNLKYIYCSSCDLNKLDVSQNRKLIFLNCMNNNLKTLDVSKNGKLKELYCDSNKLKKIQVAGNTALEVLSVSKNKIRDIDTSKLTKLEKLYVEYNKLRRLNVTKNQKLILLNCNRNKLRKLNVKKNKSLDFLACAGNKLRSLDLSKNKLLQCLFCYDNQLLTGNVKLAASQLDTYKVSKQKRTIKVKKIGKNYYVPLDGINSTNVIKKLSIGKITGRGIRLSGKKIPAKITYEYNMFTDGKIKTEVEIKVKK